MSGDVNTGGGANIGRDVSTGGGNFAGRDEKPIIINANTTEWREGVYVKLESHEQRITDLEVSEHFRRHSEGMTTYEKFVIAGFVFLILAFAVLAYEMRNLTEQLSTNQRFEQFQRYRP